MLRLSRMTDYAVVVLVRMARGGPVVMTAPGLAAATNLPEPSVGKILKQLAQARLVSAHRGAAGGYVLARPAGDIRVSEVVAALEGEVALTACVDGAEGGCRVEATCPVRGRWDPVNRAVRAALEEVSLADMAGMAAMPVSAATAGPIMREWSNADRGA
ncbi:MAG: SUF system Fe-S cluster assembly regulator [Rhodospirillales bacterium]|nr:SUF system Fe-S cluster assembly regulator [Rhodospirillales bacterium]